MGRWRFWLAQGLWGGTALLLLMLFSGFDRASTEWGFILLGGAFIGAGFLLRWGQQPERNLQNNYFMPRILATVFLWITYLAGVIAGAQEMGGLIIVLALILMVPLIAMNMLIWIWDRGIRGDFNLEKRKRERIDQVLRDLSDDDLVRLRERLSDGTIKDEQLRYMLDADGELVVREQQ